MLIGLSANGPLGGLLVGVCRLGMWSTYLFECCLVFRLHWDGLVGMWLCLPFLVSSFWPRRVEGTVYFFFVVIFWTPAWAAFCVVCGGLFFWLGLGFSRPWFWNVVLKFFFLWRVWSWLRTNAGGVLNTCKSNGKALLLWLSLIHIWRCRRYAVCRSRWSPYH